MTIVMYYSISHPLRDIRKSNAKNCTLKNMVNVKEEKKWASFIQLEILCSIFYLFSQF